MADYDVIVKGGRVATAADVSYCDIGIRDGKIATLTDELPVSAGERVIDARGKLVLPGGIESHCHVEQKSAAGIMTADDFYSASVSAAFGGTTTIIPFAAQHRGDSLRKVVDEYHDCAGPKAVIDYAFHLIISDATEQVIGQELPALIRDGYTSFKIYTTYDLLKLDDYAVLDVLAVARREGAMVMVHAENHDVIRWLSDRLLEGGHRAARYHAVAHAKLAEGEATNRVIVLSELVDVPLLVVHVSSEEATNAIRTAQNRGLRIYAETCPQYLFLTAEDLDRPGTEGTKFCCSPPPRDENGQAAIWRGIENGTFEVFSSDHAPYRHDETGKLYAGPDPDFKHVANGVPGIEARLPLLFSEGVLKGRISLDRFVALASTNAAKLYGLQHRKGTIRVGADADIAVWDTEKEVTLSTDVLHDNVGYTPYEGMKITGWPTTVLSRGRIVVENETLHVEAGSGEFLPCASPDPARPKGQRVSEMEPARNFGAELL